ncbi:hypothetical protein [Dyella sp. 2HG41-7]|uniref:hypothetical protein n=1 Tax=Dyella sp. 2HG41-7 TaxID=2883239 RepID=UPI001F3551EC|nr:hypothetical protein [Dyella sp. 2HG41-7]
MDGNTLIPVVLFLSIAVSICYVVKQLVQSRLRIKMLQTCNSTELVESLVMSDARRDQLTALRWGLLSITEAIGLGLVQLMGWTYPYFSVPAILLGAFGLGSLLYFWFGRRFG